MIKIIINDHLSLPELIMRRLYRISHTGSEIEEMNICSNDSSSYCDFAGGLYDG